MPDLGPQPGLIAPDALAMAASLDSGANAAFPTDHWWQAMGDAQLAALIDEGLANSPTVAAAAAARVAAAQAQAMQAGGATGPSFGADASAGGQVMSQNQGFPPGLIPGTLRSTGRLATTFAFDLDLWGRNRAALRAAVSESTAAAVDAQQARLQLSTAIAAHYAQLGGQVAQVAAASDARDIASATARLTQQRVSAGLDNAGASAMAATRLAEADSALLAARQDEVVTRHALAALLGAGPDRGLSIMPTTVPVVTTTALPANLPMDLIGRRPDLVSARLRTEAAAARIGVARADFYPSINLSAVAGLQSIGLADLISGQSFFTNFGPALHLPLFARQGPQGRYREARAHYDQSVADYNQTLLTALREVADAISAQRATQARLAAAHTGLAAAGEARRIAALRYREGLSNQIVLLSADQSLVNARRAVAALEAQSLVDNITLIRALGGGFADPTLQTPLMTTDPRP